MADFFIKRPILSICLSVIIVLLGAFSILRLPISEYPDILLWASHLPAAVGSQRAGSLPAQDKRSARPGRQPVFSPGDL